MLFHIILRETRSNILSLRMFLALILTLTVFGLGTFTFVVNYQAERQVFERSRQLKIERVKYLAEERGLVQLAHRILNQDFGPRSNSFISNSREKYLPQRFEYNSFHVPTFHPLAMSHNPLIESRPLSWMFIISIIISFTVLLLAYDTVSGEKEARTLALSLSNSVSRGLVLFGKYLSVILSTILVLVPGIALSLVIILSSGKISITRGTLVEIGFFLAVAILFVACITAFGILASVLTHRANVSLVAALSFWLLFVVVVPNTAIYWTQSLFPIEKMENVMRRIDMEREDIEKQMPEGWSENRSSYMENRAKLENDLLAAEMKVRRDWYNQMFSQYERTRLITALSPISIFEYLCEAVVGGGYLRFRKNWRDMNSFQLEYLQFVKETDAKDSESSHQLNPGTWFGSHEPVDIAEVPFFKEKAPSFPERFSHAGIYLLLMVIYTAAAFALSFVLFVRYDVR